MSDTSQPAPQQPVFWSWLDLILFFSLSIPCLLVAALLVHGIFMMLPFRPAGHAPELLAAQFLGYAFWFLALYLMLKLKYDRPFWRSLGWQPGARGPLFYFAAGPALAFSVGLLGVLMRTPDLDTPLKALLSDRTSILLIGVFATTLGPLCEELAFRGFFLPLLIRSTGVVPGILLSALPFGLLHGREYAWSWRHILLVTLAGVVFGWVRWRTGSTSAATLVHAGYNMTFFAGFLAQGKQLPGV